MLDYPHLPLDAEKKAAAMAEFDNLIKLVAPESLAEQVTLPVCKDKEDQKFMELARDARAEILITKDKALLKLAKRTAKRGLFAIMLPEQWLQSGK